MSGRQRLPAPQFFSSWGEAIISAVLIGATLVGLALLHIEFPHGIADLKEFRIQLVHQ